MTAPVSIRPLRAGEGLRLRSLRLAALLCDPDAFGGTHADSLTKPPAFWEQRAVRSDSGEQMRYFIASDAGGQPVGMALARVDDRPVENRGRPNGAVINGMWVAPDVRGQRVAQRLCDACIDWATGRGFTELSLDVIVGNAPALGAYQAVGFDVMGKGSAVYGERTLHELYMRRALR